MRVTSSAAASLGLSSPRNGPQRPTGHRTAASVDALAAHPAASHRLHLRFRTARQITDMR